MVKIRDKHASAHALRVRTCAMVIAAKIGVSAEQEEELSIAALLYDLGGVEIPRNGAVNTRMSADEQTLVQAYFECEARLLHSIPELASVAEIVSCHRENYDGSGTPRGLKAEQIPLLCRILRLADEYHHMILPKASAPMTHDEAMRFLTQRSGRQFDPMVIEVLSQLSPEELGKQQHQIPTYSEYSRLRQDSLDVAYVEAVL